MMRSVTRLLGVVASLRSITEPTASSREEERPMNLGPSRFCRPVWFALAMGLSVAVAYLAWADDEANTPSGHRAAGATQPAGLAPEAAFLAENDIAMTKMMRGMTVTPTGNVDHDFVAMMVPHHQGAIDMAVAVLRHGHNEQLRRLAQEIIVTQQQEIAAMRLVVGESLPPSVPSPTQPSPPPPQHQSSTSHRSMVAPGAKMNEE
jgi:hypothetical protein